MILKPLSKLLFKIRLAQLSDINTRAPFLLATVEPFRMEPDLATHQGVVCVTVRAVVRACVEDVLNSGSSDKDKVQLMPLL